VGGRSSHAGSEVECKKARSCDQLWSQNGIKRLTFDYVTVVLSCFQFGFAELVSPDRINQYVLDRKIAKTRHIKRCLREGRQAPGFNI
jgi:hypothetical protein